MTPLELLFEQSGLPQSELPAELAELYGGPLGFDEPATIANFVQTIDGVVAIPGRAGSERLLSAESDADRFLMGLLRSFADVVVVGAATMAAWPRGTWRPERSFPPAADAFAELRRLRGRPPAPAVAVVTTGATLDPAHPALARGVVVFTTADAAGKLRSSVPAASEIVVVNNGDQVDPALAIAALRERGHSLVLSEAGPRLFTDLVRAGLVDELFLTKSPLLAGSGIGLVDDPELLQPAELLSLRRSDSHLFLRYRLSAD